VARWLKAHGATAEDPALVAVGFSTDEFHRASNRRAFAWEKPVYPLLDASLSLDRSGCEQVIRDAGLPVPPKSSCYFCPFHRPQTWAEMRRDEPHLFWKAVELERLLNARRDAISCHTADVPAVDVVEVWAWFDGRAPHEAIGYPEDYDDFDPGEGGSLAYDEAIAAYIAAHTGDSEHGHMVRFGRCPDCNRRDRLRLDDGDLVPPHPKDHVFFTRFGRPLDEAIGEAQASLFDDVGGPESCDDGYCLT
jgi:hypothetical protein